MADDKLFESIKELGRRITAGDTGGGLPLCGKCGGAHEGECPSINCSLCGTTHKRNSPFHYENCERNDRFREWYKGHQDWVGKNTAEIWGQSDKEEDEQEDED